MIRIHVLIHLKEYHRNFMYKYIVIISIIFL